MCDRIDEEIGESVELGDRFLGCSRIEFDEEGLEHLSLGCLEIDEAAIHEWSQHPPAIDEGTGQKVEDVKRKSLTSSSCEDPFEVRKRWGPGARVSVIVI